MDIVEFPRGFVTNDVIMRQDRGGKKK
jgi:hypothetical protein